MDDILLHANSVNALCGSLIHYIPCDPITDSLIKCVLHLQTQVSMLLQEIETLKKEKENA